MRRGEVRWYTFAEPDKRRPVLLLTREPMVGRLNEITVAAITTTVRNLDSEVRLSPADGMPADCVTLASWRSSLFDRSAANRSSRYTPPR